MAAALIISVLIVALCIGAGMVLPVTHEPETLQEAIEALHDSPEPPRTKLKRIAPKDIPPVWGGEPVPEALKKKIIDSDEEIPF